MKMLQTSHRMSSAEDAIFTSNYLPRLPRLDFVDELLTPVNFDPAILVGATVFVDSSPELWLQRKPYCRPVNS